MHPAAIVKSGQQQAALFIDLVMGERLHAQPTLAIKPKSSAAGIVACDKSLVYADFEIADKDV
ncbi:hypothetical protein D1872_280170 [compost metagenome]